MIGNTPVLMLLASSLVLAGQGFRADSAPADQGSLENQLEAVRQATRKYLDHSRAVADGFRRFSQEGALMGEHWFRRDLIRAPLDLTRPAVLQYANIDGTKVLVGVAFATYLGHNQSVPEGFAGSQDRWHIHDLKKILNAAAEGRPFLKRLAGRRRFSKMPKRLAMVHAWVWMDNPRGMFAQEHPLLPYLRAGLPAFWGASADSNTAWGMALLDDGTCEYEIRKIHFLAKLSDRQHRILSQACDAAARGVRTQLAARGDDPDALNRVASRSWNDFTKVRDETLTPPQRDRLAVRMEHPSGHDHQVH